MKSSSQPISVTVNYFNPKDDPRVEAMAELALRSLQAFTTGELQTIVADGSGKVSNRMAKLCADSDWEYLPSSDKEPFAVTYNRGMKHSRYFLRAWMASDIFVAPDWDGLLSREMERTKASMACPLLSTSDYFGQMRNFIVSRRTFVPSWMTFNLNVVTEDTLTEIGEIDERFSGCFNDIDYLLRLRAKDRIAIVVDAGNITHLAFGTRATATMVDCSEDMKHFHAKYPYVNIDDWDYIMNISPLARSRLFFHVRNLIHAIPSVRASKMLREMVDRFEPLFHGI